MVFCGCRVTNWKNWITSLSLNRAPLAQMDKDKVNVKALLQLKQGAGVWAKALLQ